MENEEEKEVILLILRNLKTQFEPPCFSLDGLASADPIWVLKGTFLEIFLNLQNKN